MPVARGRLVAGAGGGTAAGGGGRAASGRAAGAGRELSGEEDRREKKRKWEKREHNLFWNIWFYRPSLEVLICVDTSKTVKREYGALYSYFTGRQFTGSVRDALKRIEALV
jgi:hypothetical protein